MYKISSYMFWHYMAAIMLFKQMVIALIMCHLFRTFVEIFNETSLIFTILLVLGWLN